MSWDSEMVQPICHAQPCNACIVESHPHILRANRRLEGVEDKGGCSV